MTELYFLILKANTQIFDSDAEPIIHTWTPTKEANVETEMQSLILKMKTRKSYRYLKPCTFFNSIHSPNH